LGVPPLGFHQLMEWTTTQSETTKTAILSSIVTIVGFLIAYATATSNWKSQLFATLKLQAAGEIETFFEECSKLATDCKIYANALVKAVNQIQEGSEPDKKNFLAHYNRDQGQFFMQKRERLMALSAEVYLLQSRYSNLLLSAPGLKTGLDLAAKALTNITDKLWIFVPFHIENDENPVRTFLEQVNVNKCIELVNAIDENQGELNFSSGSVKGTLISAVVGFNFWLLYYLYKHRKDFAKTITERYLKLQKNG
jgi:hypothetical protein